MHIGGGEELWPIPNEVEKTQRDLDFAQHLYPNHCPSQKMSAIPPPQATKQRRAYLNEKDPPISPCSTRRSSTVRTFTATQTPPPLPPFKAPVLSPAVIAIAENAAQYGVNITEGLVNIRTDERPARRDTSVSSNET